MPAPHVPTAGKVAGAMQYFLETPNPGQEIAGAFVPVRGWVWHPKGIETIEARTPKASVPSKVRFGRPDIFKALCDHPHGYHTGFYIEIEREVWGEGTELWAQSREGEWGRFARLDVALHDEVFAQAHENLLRVLVCPTCFTPMELRSPKCTHCGRPVEWMNVVPSFLGPRPSPLARGEPVSRHTVLDDVIPGYFDLEDGGLFLDAGAGWPPTGHGEVIQLEIERFPSTNVVADGGELPFAEGTFDGVISHAVMEHVRDPFGYSRDLVRVLKPGGRFLCHSAFLQPVHAYPDHFFNTTLEGLKELFKGVKIIEAGVAPFQKPWLALEWILRSYCAGFTNEEDRKRFQNMRIADLLGDMDEDRPLSEFQSLNEDANLELAAGVYILGER
jgi:SAM-dependent methyltransferase